MSHQRPHVLITFLLFSGLMSLSCSGPLTCALEGCKQDNGVVLANDYQAGVSADATAEKDSLAQKVNEVFQRLGATEALASLLQETVKLQDSRIKMLEDHAKVVEDHLEEIDSMIAHHEDEIHAQNQALRVLEISFTAKLEEHAAAEKLAREAVQTDLDATEVSLKNSITTLDQNTQSSILSILETMKEERRRVDDADKSTAAAAANALIELQTSLLGKIKDLENADKDIRLEMATQIGLLDARISTLNAKSTLNFSTLWASLRLLQGQIVLVAADNILEQNRIRSEIAAVKSALNTEIVKLQVADKKTAEDILNLYAKQEKTQTQLDALESNYDRFVAEQKLTNLSIQSNYSTLTNLVGELQKELTAHVSSEAARVTEIVQALLPDIASRVTSLETLTGSLQNNLNTLEGRIDQLEGDFSTVQAQHTTLRLEYDAFVSTTNAELVLIKSMVTAIDTCTITPLASGNGNGHSNKITLTCGSTSVNLTTSSN